MNEEWLDSSKLETFQLCPQKYRYRYEEHLVPLERKRDNPLLFGGALHRSLESLYKGTAFDRVACPLGPCRRCNGQPIPRISAIFLTNYTDDPTDLKEIRTVDRGLELLVQYLNKWKREPFKTVAVEQTFELPMGIFKYIGRIDLIINWGDVWMTVDHKSTSRFGLLFDSSFKLSGQFTGYMLGASAITGHEITNAMANALRITTKIDDSSFARIFTTRTPVEFEEWQRQVEYQAQTILAMRAANLFPKNAPFACGAYNRICDYYPLCVAAPEQREVLKTSSYEVQPWEPRKDSDD
jgi:hypothetical protein